MKKSIFIIFNILVIVFAFTNSNYANKYLKEEYELIGGKVEGADNGHHIFDWKIEEAKRVTKTENPLDLVVAYKEEMDGRIDGSYQDVGQHDYYLDEDPNLSDYQKNMIIKIIQNTNYMIDNIENNTIPQSYIQNIKEINDSKNIKLLVVLSFLLIASIVILVLTKKKIIIVASVVILLIGIYHLIPTNQLIDKHNHIEEYVLGISNNNISDDVDVDKSINEMKKTLNLKWNISKLINDYIIKVSSCYYLLDNDKEWHEEYYDTYDNITHDTFDYIDDFRNSSNNYIKDLPLLKYKTNEGFIELSYEIQQSGIKYDEIKNLYDNIKINNNISFNDFLTELSIKINNDVMDESELLFHYLARIIDSVYVRYSSEYYNNEVISDFKDWYIDGESRNIELPYGVILEYKEPEFIKKDIKEIVYTNESELNIDNSDKQVYVMYYKDSIGEIGASYTDVQFVKRDGDYEILFNPVDLLYDIKEPTIRLVLQ